jgi:hypothetical protein
MFMDVEEAEEPESKGFVLRLLLLVGRGGFGSPPCNLSRRSLNQGGSTLERLPSSHQASMGAFCETPRLVDESPFRRGDCSFRTIGVFGPIML